MTHRSKNGGFGPKETALAVIVIVVTAAILIPLAIRKQGDDLILGEAQRMRQLYIGLSMYEEQFDFEPSPNMLGALPYQPNHLAYQSTRDPFLDAGAGVLPAWPADAGLDNREYAPFRMSFSYLQDFVRANKIAIQPWATVSRFDPNLGELANEWLGIVQPQQFPHAMVSGTLLRIGTDGAAHILKDRGGPKPLGDAQDLFIRRGPR